MNKGDAEQSIAGSFQAMREENEALWLNKGFMLQNNFSMT